MIRIISHRWITSLLLVSLLSAAFVPLAEAMETNWTNSDASFELDASDVEDMEELELRAMLFRQIQLLQQLYTLLLEQRQSYTQQSTSQSRTSTQSTGSSSGYSGLTSSAPRETSTTNSAPSTGSCAGIACNYRVFRDGGDAIVYSNPSATRAFAEEHCEYTISNISGVDYECEYEGEIFRTAQSGSASTNTSNTSTINTTGGTGSTATGSSGSGATAQPSGYTYRDGAPSDCQSNSAPFGPLTILGDYDDLIGKTLIGRANAIEDADGVPFGAVSSGYQWLRNGSPINGATNRNYVVSADDAGSTITMRWTYVDGCGNTETVSTIEDTTREVEGTQPSGGTSQSGSQTNNTTNQSTPPPSNDSGSDEEIVCNSAAWGPQPAGDTMSECSVTGVRCTAYCDPGGFTDVSCVSDASCS